MLCICYVYNLVHNVCVNLVHISRNVTHNVYMQAVCNHMNLVRIPRRDRMNLALCYVYDSRRDRGKRSRSPKSMMRRSRS